MGSGTPKNSPELFDCAAAVRQKIGKGGRKTITQVNHWRPAKLIDFRKQFLRRTVRPRFKKNDLP